MLKLQTEAQYRGLFDELKLSIQEKEILKGLLLDSQLPDEGGAFVEEEIRGFLGDERFAVYERFSSTLAERLFVALFAQRLHAIGYVLSKEKEREIVSVLDEENSSLDFDDWVASRGADTSDAEAHRDFVAAYITAHAELDQRVLSRLEGVLSKVELDELATLQEQKREMFRVDFDRNEQRMLKEVPHADR